MKNFLLMTTAMMFLLLFAQCQKDEVSPDEMLIAEIENAQNKVNIEPEALPADVKMNIEDEHFDTYIETAAHVPGKGYEVILGNEDQVYFRENGLRLRGRNDGPHRPGPCGRGLLIPVDELPAAITEYVSTNYPDAEILRAKKFPRGYVLLISGRRLLIFNNESEFIAETRVFHLCDVAGHPIDIGDLPDAITSYIATNYPDAEIVKAFGVRGRIVVGLLTPDGRKIVVFDTDGNFLFERN